MRWRPKSKCPPRCPTIGDVSKRSGFLFLPLTLRLSSWGPKETRWLEHTSWVEVYSRLNPHTTKEMPRYGWKKSRWAVAADSTLSW